MLQMIIHYWTTIVRNHSANINSQQLHEGSDHLSWGVGKWQNVCITEATIKVVLRGTLWRFDKGDWGGGVVMGKTFYSSVKRKRRREGQYCFPLYLHVACCHRSLGACSSEIFLMSLLGTFWYLDQVLI